MENSAEGTVVNLPITSPQPGIEWFWLHGCVVERDGIKQVFIAGALRGWFAVEDRDRGPRNVLLLTLAKEPARHFGHLAQAFRFCNYAKLCSGNAVPPGRRRDRRVRRQRHAASGSSSPPPDRAAAEITAM